MGAEATGSILHLHTIGHKMHIPCHQLLQFLFYNTLSLRLSHNAEVTVAVMTKIIDSICMTPFTEGH